MKMLLISIIIIHVSCPINAKICQMFVIFDPDLLLCVHMSKVYCELCLTH